MEGLALDDAYLCRVRIPYMVEHHHQFAESHPVLHRNRRTTDQILEAHIQNCPVYRIAQRIGAVEEDDGRAGGIGQLCESDRA